jgi:hypothetical protein
MIVDPVQVYLASDADESKLRDKARGVGARYFPKALSGAVSSAFPNRGPAGPFDTASSSGHNRRRRSGQISTAASEGALDHTIDIGKVGIEMKLVDSETGEQIAAMVDRENLGAGAEIGSVHFSRQKKWAAAYELLTAGHAKCAISWIRHTNCPRRTRSERINRPYGDDATKQ